MVTSVCTLFERDFHYGVGALANSLVSSGFKGNYWIGYRNSLPPWCESNDIDSQINSMSLPGGLEIHFVKLDIDMQFAFYKPMWMQTIFNSLDPSCEALFYFDPDIVVKAKWAFFEEWIKHGLTMCEDVNNQMSEFHPIRLAWKKYLNENGFHVIRELNNYYNSGFLGIGREYLSALKLWEKYTLMVAEECGGLRNWPPINDRTHRFSSPNQDTFNLLAMTTDHPISTVGPDGMDFIPGGYIMSHAIRSLKPWRKKPIRFALKGIQLSLADKGYWQHAEGPIKLYHPMVLYWHRFNLKLASGINRFIKRNS